jgi:hypothetical protein
MKGQPNMKRLLGTAALILLMGMGGASAAVIGNLGVNPSSAGGNFSNAPGAGAFTDQVLFDLVGGLTHITIASATNTFASVTDLIANFTGSIYQVVGGVGGADDILVFGPTPATANCGDFCQGFGGSAFLAPGSYYAQLSGIAGSTAGYAGNISTAVSAIPIPAALPLFGTALAGLVAMKRRRRSA